MQEARKLKKRVQKATFRQQSQNTPIDTHRPAMHWYSGSYKLSNNHSRQSTRVLAPKTHSWLDPKFEYIQPTQKMKKAICLISLATLLGGCASHQTVNSSAVTAALDLEKTDNFAVRIIDTSVTDTAYSSDMQKAASSYLIEELEDRGFDYVGERNPEIRFTLRTYPAVDSSYLNTTSPEEVTITTTEEVKTPTGTVTSRTETQTVESRRGTEAIYLPANSRIILLDVYDSTTDVLLWRGYITAEDTSLNSEKLQAAIEELVERLEEET